MYLRLLIISIFMIISQNTLAEVPIKGAFKLTSTASDILGPEISATNSSVIKEDEELKWEVFVPSSYNPENPPGVMVYVSPENHMKNVPASWTGVMEQNNLIWIAATMSGNTVLTGRRILKALMALPLIQESYKINQNRFYVSGFSGGGRIASIIAKEFPHLFKGAIYNCGVNYWDRKAPSRLDLIQKNRYVFITGTDDFNLEDTKNVYRKYKKAGVKNVKLMIITRMPHSNPSRVKFNQAVKYLDDKS